MDGSVVIGTELDTKQLDKQIKDSKKELEKYEKEAEELLRQRSELDIDTQKAQKELDAVDKKIADIKSKMAEMETTPWKTEGATYKLLGKDLVVEEQKRKEILQEIESKYVDIDAKIKDNQKSQERVRQEIIRGNQELQKAKGIDNISKSVNDIGNSLKRTVSQTIRWGLAIFGVRSAYMFLSQSMSTLAQYDDKMAVDIQYIRYLLASTLKPVIEKIIQLAYTLLAYINYIMKALFGVNLFANANTEAFKKQNKALGGSVSKAKELKKTLAGFDEMNILQDNGDVSSGGGGGGVDLSPYDNLPNLDDFPIPKWLEDFINFILKYKDEVIAAILGIAAAIVILKLTMNPVLALGIGLIIMGITYAVEKLLDYLKDPTWENFGGIIQGIAIALIGLALVVSGPAGIVIAIIGAIVLLYGTIIKHWQEIKAFLEKWIGWLVGRSDAVHKYFGDTIGDWYDTVVKILSNMVKGWDSTFTTIKGIFDDFIKLVKAIINGDWKAAWESAKNIVDKYMGMVKRNILLVLDSIFAVVKTIALHVGNAIWGVLKGAINGILSQVDEAINSPIKALNKLLNVINKIPGVNISTVRTITVPRLAKGGIINMPGKGVPIGSAIVGERGAEGVIPLTDSQQMALLGEAIGKYITVNANIVNTMNGRVISRELKTIQNESDFAYNR